MHAAHDVVRGRTDLHRLLRNVDIAERFELMMHTRQLAFDMFLRVRHSFLDPGNIEIDTAMRSPPPFFDLAHDAARDVIARQQLRRPARVLVALSVTPALLFIISRLRFVVLWDEIEHETFPIGVCEDTAFAAHTFGHEHSGDARRPNHARGVKLHVFHIDQRRPGVIGK